MSVDEIRTNAELISHLAQGSAAEYIFFWGHRPRKSGVVDKSCFSQWFPSPFKVEGITYPCAEHFMMAEKARLFDDEDIHKQIIATRDPKKAKALGRKVRGFHKDVWEKNRCEIVVRGNLEKFSQSDSLKRYLLGTIGKILVEASPADTIWGIGLSASAAAKTTPADWKGLNLLGYALMEVRLRLRDE